ncbi:hypothetical protein LPJ38_26935 [Bradyrhizobium daqingense]|uniref:hypothetical protein n=1 Tax=Bradyrhizobium daqingense TaxID=993502 RepID=UPI00119EACEB|nr:hypothetical protein [Bradyrhizobium daqingense]UFS87262.1 hypothetical protein LPJ38_26935 [Bradyrhizobium daqingense]
MNRTIAIDVEIMRDTVQRLRHPSVPLVGITVARDLKIGLERHRGQQLGAHTLSSDPRPQTFMGLEIIEDPAMPSGTFEIITNGDAFADRVREIRSR